eukprot:6204797-Pleurochrysis_carterae.AAC.4
MHNGPTPGCGVALQYPEGRTAMIDVCRQATYGYDQRAEVRAGNVHARSLGPTPACTSMHVSVLSHAGAQRRSRLHTQLCSPSATTSTRRPHLLYWRPRSLTRAL